MEGGAVMLVTEPGKSWIRDADVETVTYIHPILTYLLTYSMEQFTFWEANQFSTSQEIPRILWKPKVHYRIHKCWPPAPYPQPARSIPYPTFHFLNIYLNMWK